MTTFTNVFQYPAKSRLPISGRLPNCLLPMAPDPEPSGAKARSRFAGRRSVEECPAKAADPQNAPAPPARRPLPAAYCPLPTAFCTWKCVRSKEPDLCPRSRLLTADCLLHLKVRQAQRTGPVRAFPAAFCLLLSAYCRLTSAFWPKRSVTIAAST